MILCERRRRRRRRRKDHLLAVKKRIVDLEGEDNVFVLFQIGGTGVPMGLVLHGIVVDFAQFQVHVATRPHMEVRMVTVFGFVHVGHVPVLLVRQRYKKSPTK